MSKVAIIYWTGSGNTEQMANLIAEGAAAAGAEVTNIHVSQSPAEAVAGADVLVLGSPSMGVEVIEESEMEPFVESLAGSLKGKKVALFGSYGWGDGGWMREWVERMNGYGAQVLEEGLIVQGSPDGGEADRCKEYGTKVANF
ncbi:MAG: flavodoxin [Negativicutes bacterium]|nr:flavodoxin [Negativicutes bacterium]